VPGPGRRPRVAGAPRRPAGADAPRGPAIAGAPRSPAIAPCSPVVAATQPAPPPAPGPVAIGGPADGPGLLVVGRVGRPQGVRGEVTVEVRTDDPAGRFADGARLLTEPTGRGPLVVASSRDQNGRLVVLFEGVEDRNGAEALRDTLVLVDGASLPPTDDPDEFHDFQLVGLVAELPDGSRLGVVAEVLHLPHGDVLAVRRDLPGVAEVLVPFVHAMVPVVDLEGGRVVIDPPDGLLDLTAPEPPEGSD